MNKSQKLIESLNLKTKHFLGVSVKHTKPTNKHVPVIWECMLGSVFTRLTDGKIKYYDVVNKQQAIDYAKGNYTDLRVYKADKPIHYGGWPVEAKIKSGKTVLWGIPN